MAGRPPEVDHTREDLFYQIESARSLVAAITQLPVQVHPNAPLGIHPSHTLQVVELAFMGMVASWEEFLERALVRYVAGAKTKSGYKPTPKYGSANSIVHAYALLSGNSNYDPSKHYLRVTDTKWVQNNADYFFQSHSFSVLQTKAAMVNHAMSVRNRIAHSSEKCRADFKETALHYIGPANGKLVKGYTPGSLLRAPVTQHFPNSVIQAGDSHFEAYAKLYEHLGTKIVPK